MQPIVGCSKFRFYVDNIIDISIWSDILEIIFDFLSSFTEKVQKHSPAMKEDERFIKEEMGEEEEKEERKEKREREREK